MELENIQPELIYHLLPKPAPPQPARTLYRSRKLQAAQKAPPLASTFGCFGAPHVLGTGRFSKKSHATFGRPLHMHAAIPQKYLKGGEKKQRVTAKAEVSSFEYPKTMPTKPPLPRTPPALMGLHSEVDFLRANAWEVINGTPEEHKFEDGTRKKCNYGHEPIDYLKKESYGKVPMYLRRVQHEIAQEDAVIKALAARQFSGHETVKKRNAEERSTDKTLKEDEVQDLIVGLKAKWDTLNAIYQKTAHHGRFQSAGAQRRQVQQEKEMLAVKADIELLEKAKTCGIVVTGDYIPP